MSSPATDRAVVAYRAVNTVNGHLYIGFTTQGLPRRIQQHVSSARRGGGWLLHAAIRKYGAESIVFETIFDFDGDEELAKLYEIEAIAKYRPEYNISRGGDGGTVHPDTARKISEANKGQVPIFKGRKFSAEALAKFRETKARNGKPSGNTGKKASPEKLEKMRLAAVGKPSAMKGKTYSAAIRARMTEAARKRKPRAYTEADKNRIRAAAKLAYVVTRKPVKCLTDGQVFVSARAASLFYGLAKNKVSKLISGENKPLLSGLRFTYDLSSD